MQMISDHRWGIWLVCLPLWAGAADPPCKLATAERSGPGWLNVKNKPASTWVYVVSRQAFETGNPPVAWTANLQARNAALKGFTDHYRKTSGTGADNQVLVVKNLQTKLLQCAEGVHLAYEVNPADLSWSAVDSTGGVSKDSANLPNDASRLVERPTLTVPPTLSPPPQATPKVIIED